MTRGLKFRIKVVEGLYYPYTENEDADQLHSYCAADLCLCFRIYKKLFFFITRLILFRLNTKTGGTPTNTSTNGAKP